LPSLRYILQIESEGLARAAMSRLGRMGIDAEAIACRQADPEQVPGYVDLGRGGWLLYVDPARWNDAAMALEEMQQYPERD
jgi:hypothetical protein